MPDGKQLNEPELDELEGPEISYHHEYLELRITIPIGDDDPSKYHVRPTPMDLLVYRREDSELISSTKGDNFNSVHSFHLSGGRSDGSMTLLGHDISDGSMTLFGHDISSDTKIREDESNLLMIKIPVPSGFRIRESPPTVVGFNGYLRKIMSDETIELNLPSKLPIEFSQHTLKGGGMEQLASELELTDFESEVVRVLLIDAIERTASQRNYDFTPAMKQATANILAQIFATEFAEAKRDTDD